MASAMVDPALKAQLLEDLENLPPEKQIRVAEYAHTLVGSEGEPRRSGAIPPRVADPEERKRILQRVVDRMKNNPIPEGAPRFSRDELHERG